MALNSITDQLALVKHFIGSAERALTRGDYSAMVDFLNEVSSNALKAAEYASHNADSSGPAP